MAEIKYVLGINAYHGDSSACLIKDGKLVAALEEERIRRIKHWAGFPSESIKFCLNFAGIGIKDIDYITIGRKPKAHTLERIIFVLKNRPDFSFLIDRIKNRQRVKNIKQEFIEVFDLKPEELKAQFFEVEHHDAHLASAFFVSPFDKAAVLSVDGMGDFISTMWGIGNSNSIKTIGHITYPHSLGFFYTAITQYLGFWKWGDEYKVMGLSAFGKPVYLDKMRQMIKIKKNGYFELNLDYFIHHKKGSKMASWEGGEPLTGQLFSEKLVEEFGAIRGKDDPIAEHHKNIAASAQALYEEIFFYILENLYQQTKCDVLCFAGGTAQNSLANGKIFKNSNFKEIYIPPAGYDAGIAVGAAFYAYNQILNQSRGFIMDSAYWGPEYGDEEIKNILDKNNLKYKYFNDDNLIKTAAKFLADGMVIGWFQGRTEWGPRALGNRSILANPCISEMKDILNLKIKKRESFRPFAPSILEERVGDYFEDNYPVPFMEKVYFIKSEKRKEIPAVVHIDGTGRLQSVSLKTNQRYWKLINEFGNLTGVPILINTSFNENEPIVNHPQEAINCFLRTKMDIIVIGNYLINRE